MSSLAGKSGWPSWGGISGRTVFIAVVSAMLGAAGGWVGGRASREPRGSVVASRLDPVATSSNLQSHATVEPLQGVAPAESDPGSSVANPTNAPHESSAVSVTTPMHGAPRESSAVHRNAPTASEIASEIASPTVNIAEQTANELPAPTADANTADGLSAEMQLIVAAESALRASDPTRALSLTDEHARVFPSGVLSEERTAVRIVALCELGRLADGRAEAARFLINAPRSPYAARVRAACQNADGARE